LINKTAKKRRKNGLCPGCGNVPESGYIYCKTCVSASAASGARARKERKTAGLCINCGKQPPRPKKAWCQDCFTNWQQSYQAIQNSGICCKCKTRDARPEKVLCQECADYSTLTCLQRREKYRQEKRCTVCGDPALENRSRCLACSFNARLKILSGVEKEKARAALINFLGKCECCETTKPGGKGQWCMDHDHDSMQFRGIICHNCNSMLGHARDSLHRLKSGIDYLERVQCTKS